MRRWRGNRTTTGWVGGLAVLAVAGVTFQTFRAEAITPGESTFEPITPCRLFDTRPDFQVGPRSSPIPAGEEYDLQVTGNQGECMIPAAATAVSINLTGVGATERTFLSMYPADTANPGTAVLNLAPGAPPTPNKIDVKLSAGGQVTLFNRFGSVHVVGDVMGYYLHAGLDELEREIAGLRQENDALASRLAALEQLTESMTIEVVDGQPTVRFTGVNVQVVSGSGGTFQPPNGLGNLIVGYNDNFQDTRSGSHTLVVGPYHSYSASYGVIAGAHNLLTGDGGSVLGGRDNVASGWRDAVLGGYLNTASGGDSTVAGGVENTASGAFTSVAGGAGNTAVSWQSNVVGGDQVTCDAGINTYACGEGFFVAPD